MAKESRFERMALEGRVMSRSEQEECVRGLMLDPRFNGLLGWICAERDGYVGGSCDQAIADSPGKQSHAWGSVFAMENLLVGLRGIAAKGSGEGRVGSGE